MPILAIDTSSIVSGAAVATAERLLAEIIVQLKKPQSEVLMEHIESVLKMAHLKKEELTGIAVNIGPGSFTGLRIGLVTAKMLSYSLNIPLIAVDGGEALALHHLAEKNYTGVFIDAQKGNAYFALWGLKKGRLTPLIPMQVMPLDEALKNCQEADYPVIATGELVQRQREAFERYTNIIFPLPNQLMPRPSNIAFAAIPKLKNGQFDNIMDLEPYYIRRSEAEELWEKRQNEVK